MKILHLEDNVYDAELIQQIFLSEWPDCEIKRVDSRADFVAELPGGHEIILSDFSLVNFNGLEALELAHRNFPEVPFIFLSGTIGEDRALMALRAGASDYVIKDRPQRLIPAVHRALNDAKLQRERRVAEEQLLRVQRLENVGMLAAGIAHDFNNILTPVLMAVPLLRARLTEEADRKVITTVESSVQRGAGLVRQILGFAHGVTGKPQVIQPRQLIHELMSIVAQTFPKAIRLQEDVETDLWPIRASTTQFHQVLLNLCVNARDAMPEGGTLRLHAANRQLDEMSAAGFPGARPGPHLFIEVSDTGTGIPPAVLEHMWEPFFTTKGIDHGTGLGLATVRGIINGHEGAITVQTRSGQGTTFQILLPALPGNDSALSAVASVSAPRGHGELILVVDDDANIRDITSATLRDYGYRVLTAVDGADALALFAPRSLEIRVVVTDLDLRNLDGTALAKVVHKLNPSIRILFVSASNDEINPRRRTAYTSRFLAKPFTANSLLENIHELVQTASTPPA
jgi:two-component system cell cycle sensor histidine kinase/response regulator CckA